MASPESEASNFFNHEIVKFERKIAKQRRRLLLSNTYARLQEMLAMQREELDRIQREQKKPGEENHYRIWVSKVFGIFPTEERGNKRWSYGMMLQPREAINAQRKHPYLKIFIPAGSEFEKADDNTYPEVMSAPSEIIIERSTSEEDVQSYLITEEELEPFKRSFVGTNDDRHIDLKDPAKYYLLLTSRINPNDVMTGELTRLVAEWDLVVQRTIPVHDPPA